MLTYRESDHLDLIGYTDADFAGCLDSRKSTLGYIFILASGAIAWKINLLSMLGVAKAS